MNILVFITCLIGLMFIINYLYNKNSKYKWEYKEKIGCQKVDRYYESSRIIDCNIWRITFFENYGFICMDVFLNDNLLIREQIIWMNILPLKICSIIYKILANYHTNKIINIYQKEHLNGKVS